MNSFKQEVARPAGPGFGRHVDLIPFSLKDAPALIEKVFPAQKVSFEAQRERKAGQGQTLTSLSSYWKGRKPLVLVRAIVLGCLLPQTDDAEKDLELFEALMGFDLAALGRRAVSQGAIKPAEFAQAIDLSNPWDYFSFTIPEGSVLVDAEVQLWRFPLPPAAEAEGLRVSWRRDVSDDVKASVYSLGLATLATYEERSLKCKRPEEVDQTFLLARVWDQVAQRLGFLGIDAKSTPELVDQLGILRYGHRPKVGDTFAGGGSIPFEAARMGCDVVASDLNPIACMLNWGNINIIGGSASNRAISREAQDSVAAEVDREITRLGVEHDAFGNRAKAYIYCLEIRCPDSGWLIPLAPSWVLSKKWNAVAKLKPNHCLKRFDIEIVRDVTAGEMAQAEVGTFDDGCLSYELDGKKYRTPIRSIRGDYRDAEGISRNRLRPWLKSDFKPQPEDVIQERLYCIQWITEATLKESRQATFFASVTNEDLLREKKVEDIVEKNLAHWQKEGFVHNMPIEPGEKTDEPIRTRGWCYWHQLFAPRQLLFFALYNQKRKTTLGAFDLLQMLNIGAKLCGINTTLGQGGAIKYKDVFQNQALNTIYNYACRGSLSMLKSGKTDPQSELIYGGSLIENKAASDIKHLCDLWITDPPYADAVNYHEITEFFIAWLRGKPPVEFEGWKWDSRRAVAIKGDGDDFRRGMIEAYKAMADRMPENGMQCVMFTHQDVGVWSDMVGIFWAAGLQVVAAWYIATETTSELKKGGYVQGTVTLMLRKRPAGEKAGFKQRILPAVRNEVDVQIKQMLHLNSEVKESMGEPVFNDSDLQMAGYAAALKVLTAYTSIGGMDVTTFALRPRIKGEITVVDEIVWQASEVANNLLVPEGVAPETWQACSGVQRFYLRMMDMESNGACKLDNYQNFAKAFRVDNYAAMMASMTANGARLKQANEFASRELSDVTEIGPTWLGQLFIGLQQLLKDFEPQVVIKQLMESLPDYVDLRPKLIDLTNFLARKSKDAPLRAAAEVLASRMQNQRALGQ